MQLYFIILAPFLVDHVAGFLPSSPPLCLGKNLARINWEKSRTQELAAIVDTDAEYVRQQLALKQQEYEAKRKAESAQVARQSRDVTAVKSIISLPMIPYINEEGMISDVEAGPSVKASVYGIFDKEQKLVYVGISRSVQQSLRLHLARCPDLTYGIKVQHITTPSRALLEMIKEEWISENGAVPPGNADAASQAVWEAPMDVRPLMTEQDHADMLEAKEKGREGSGMKKIARRFEYEKVDILEARGVEENLRFDPKLKAMGLLDLQHVGPNTSVPSSKP